MRLALGAASMLGMRGVAAAVLCNTIIAPPGAVYLYPEAPTNSVFSGNSFTIGGNDHTLAGSPGPAPAVYGVATRTEANAQEARGSLNGNQMDNVWGKGYVPGPPIESSIAAVEGPDAAMIEALVSALLAGPHVEVADASLLGAVALGNGGAPQMTHLTGQVAGATIAPAAMVSGAGVLVVDAGLTVSGTVTFEGLVIVRGPFAVTGSMLLFGSVWPTNLTLTVGGNAQMYYSSEGLAYAIAAGAGAVCAEPVCGDGVRTEDEACDDGNTADGDCCSAACTTVAPASTPCPDDANPCTQDRCDGSGVCMHESVAGTCDDGNACTVGDTCVAGACRGTLLDCGPCATCDSALGCVGAPAIGCAPAQTSRLGLVFALDGREPRASWRWRGGPTPPASFGDPRDMTDYAFCVFRATNPVGVVLSVAAPAGSAWTPRGRGFRYRERAATRSTRVDLAGGLASRLRYAGTGSGLDLVGEPLTLDSPLVVQLRAAGGACWEASYPLSGIVRDYRHLTARSRTP